MELVATAAPAPVDAVEFPVSSDHVAAKIEQRQETHSPEKSAPAALLHAEMLTRQIANLEDLTEQVRAERVRVLRQATTGPQAVPVSQVAKRLGMSRQRVHKLLR